jgi:hypothetical protein
MNNLRFNNFISLILISLLLVGNVFIGTQTAYADNSKTIIVTFKSAPTPASVLVTKAPIKYNKKVAFSWGFDDGYKEAYEYGFKYLSGGYNSTLNQYFNGLYFTDGAGHNRPFTGYFAWPSVNDLYEDIHPDSSLSYMSWTNLIDAYNYGWMPLNHGWTSTNFPDMGATFNYPAPHGPSLFDYLYEITQNTAHVLAQSGITMRHFVIPGGDQTYIDYAWTAGEKSVSANASSFTYGGQAHAVPVYGINVNDINFDHYVMHRESFSEGTHTTNASMIEYIDSIMAKSNDTDRYWATGFTHRVAPDATGGNLSWNKFKYLMDHIESNYGRDGADNIWMTSYQEAYDYFVVNQGVSLSTDLVDDTLTISFDSSILPNDLRHYALSLLVDADKEIESISYGSGDFTFNSENLDTGLINLDWGFFLDQDEYTKPEAKVVLAEASRVSADVTTAQGYVSVLPDGPEKNILQNRINNINIKGKTWQIDVGKDGYTAGVWNLYGGSLTSSQALNNLVDTDGNSSSVGMYIAQNFSSKRPSDGAAANPANSGYFPDYYLQDLLRIYESSTAPVQTGIVRMTGLDTNKKYDLVLIGDHATTLSPTTKTTSIYTIKGVSQQLQTSYNTSNVVTFSNVSPETNGTLDIAVSRAYTNWGYGVLNAFTIKESDDDKPQAIISSSSYRSGTGFVDVNYSLKQVNSELISLSNLKYSKTGLFSGEELSATSAVDAQNDGISNLTSSSSGISHKFVWNASSDLGEYEGNVYLHFNPVGVSKSGSLVQTEAIAVDFKAPVISGTASVSSAPTGATITWTTNEASSSKIDYGLTDSYGTSTDETDTGTRVLSHSVVLSNLSSCTTYHYRVRSKDLATNEVVGSDATFTTTGCTGSGEVLDTTTEQITTLSGGTLTLDGGASNGLTLTIPPAFTGTDANFQAQQLNSNTVLAVIQTPTGYNSVGTFLYELKALTGISTTISTFNTPITLTLSYESSDITGIDPSTLKIYRWNGTTWNQLNSCSVNTEAKTVSCTTTQFSTFGLFGQPPTITLSHSSSGSSLRYGCKDPKALNYEYFAASNPSLCKYTETTKTKFNRNLKYGMTGEDVKVLQQYLNANGFTIATKGIGSIGKETTYFGNATRSALIKFQKAKGIKPAVGYFGVVTRAFLGK